MGDQTQQETRNNLNLQENIPRGKQVSIFAATDGYGLVTSVALEEHFINQGSAVDLIISFPENSPRNFWTGNQPVSKQKLPVNTDLVFVVGIPFNNWSEETLQESQRNARSMVVIDQEHQRKLVLLNKHHTRDSLVFELPAEITDLTESIESDLEHNPSDKEVNLPLLARFIIKDPTVLKSVNSQEEREKYEQIALGVEVASRASIGWLEENQGIHKGREFLSAQSIESNRRIQISLENIRSHNWQFFLDEANKFQDLIELPTVTLPPTKGEDPTFAFFEVRQLPLGFHFLALEEVARRTKAKFVIGARYNPLVDRVEGKESPFKIKLIQNWKTIDQALGKIIDFGDILQPTDKITGSKRFTTIEVDSALRLVHLTKDVLLRLEPELNTVFEGTKVIAILGDPNTGKSTVSELIERFCNILAKPDKIAQRIEDIDRVGFTPDYFIEALARFRELQIKKHKGYFVDDNEFFSALSEYRAATEARNSLRVKEWTSKMITEVIEKISHLPDDKIFLLDMPGSLQTKDKKGNIISTDRRTPQIVETLSTGKIDGVFILGSDARQINEWRDVVEEINKERIKNNIPVLKFVGEAVTVVAIEPIAYSDKPASKDPSVKGRLSGISRTRINKPNSGIFLLSVLITSLGLQKAV